MGSSRGFSLVEGAVVVLVLGVVATIAAVSFATVRSSVGAVLAGPVVASALADVTRLAGEGGDEMFVVEQLSRYGFVAVGPEADPAPGAVSLLVSGVDGSVAVSSPSSRDRCLVGVVPQGSTAAEAGWFLVPSGSWGCGASAVLGRISGFSAGSFDSPSEVVVE